MRKLEADVVEVWSGDGWSPLFRLFLFRFFPVSLLLLRVVVFFVFRLLLSVFRCGRSLCVVGRVGSLVSLVLPALRFLYNLFSLLRR